MLIIDSHAHIFDFIKGTIKSGRTRSDRFGKIIMPDLDEFRFLPPLALKTSFTAEVFLEYMKWADIQKAVLLQSPFYGDLNRYILSVIKKWPNVFKGAAYLDIWMEGGKKRFSHILKRGFSIIKFDLAEKSGFYGLYPGIKIDSENIEWFWTDCNKERMIIVLDMGPVGSPTYQTEGLNRILNRYSQLKIIITHLAHAPVNDIDSSEKNREWKKQIMLSSKYPNVWIDLAIHPCGICFEDYPFKGTREYIKQAYEMIGADRLLWGSDIPGILKDINYPQYVNLFIEYCTFFKQEDLEKVMGQNAEKLFFVMNTL